MALEGRTRGTTLVGATTLEYFTLLFLMPADWQCQIEFHEIHQGKGLDCSLVVSRGFEHHTGDNSRLNRFVEWTQNEIAVVPDFHKRILFSDEAHFWLNGYVNKQNCRISSEANPQVYVETPLHPEKLTVWCALWAGGIIGPYFFKNDEDHNVTANGDRYRAMITNFFIPELNSHDVQEL
ncbi:putative DD41D transposase [Trichonephila clavipes]|nr:putative DD41D transposase [Trichonephila clavipes]